MEICAGERDSSSVGALFSFVKSAEMRRESGSELWNIGDSEGLHVNGRLGVATRALSRSATRCPGCSAGDVSTGAAQPSASESSGKIPRSSSGARPDEHEKIDR
jgi:hypothetical protein